MLVFAFSLSFPTPVIMVYLEIDPLHNPVRRSILVIVIRLVTLVVVFVESIKAASAFFITGLMVACSASDVLQDLRKTNFCSNLITRLKEISLYRKMFLWNKYTNQNVSWFSIPPLLFFGISLIVLAWYGTIRMLGKLEFLIYLVLPVIAVVASFFITLLIPPAERIFEYSKYLISKRTNEAKSCKFERKTWKSMRPLGIQVGQFGLVVKNFKILALQFVV